MSRDEKIIALREVLNELEHNDWTPDPIAETAVDEHLLLYYGLDKIALPEGIKQLIARAIVVIEDHDIVTQIPKYRCPFCLDTFDTRDAQSDLVGHLESAHGVKLPDTRVERIMRANPNSWNGFDDD